VERSDENLESEAASRDGFGEETLEMLPEIANPETDLSL
jgi:hypothetical protein